MIKNFARGLAVLSLSLAPLAAPAPVLAQNTEVTTLGDAVHRLPVAGEQHEGYSRGHFKHWNAGLDKKDDCDTRSEVLIAEAVEAPEVGDDCALSEGEWVSYFDDQEVEDPDKLAVHHMVPLAEAWASGAAEWGPERREDFANDQSAPASLVTVTERTDRSKAGQDPAGWMPPLPGAHCRYLSDWVSTKLRWDLAANPAELDAIAVFADGECKNTSVIYRAVK